MADLTKAWRLVEIRHSRKAVMAEWAAAAGDALPAFQPLLHPADELATAWPNPRPYGRWMLDVIHHRDGSIVAVDEADYENRIDLEPADIVLYRLDFGSLRRALSDALAGIKIARTPVDQRGSRLQIGNWEPKKAANFPVHLLLCQNQEWLRREVLELVTAPRSTSAILLTPTRANWNAELDTLARSKEMLLVPLCEVVEAAGDTLEETPAWGEYLQTFAQMIKLKLPTNYRNRKPVPRRAVLTAKIEKLRNAIVEHICAMREGVLANIDAGKGAQLPLALSKKQWAELAGLKPYHVTRSLKADPQLRELYRIANDVEQVLKFGRR